MAEGPVCPTVAALIALPDEGQVHPGAYKCYQCRKPFTVKVGTIFESSHVPMHHWLQAMALMTCSKKALARTSFIGLWASL